MNAAWNLRVCDKAIDDDMPNQSWTEVRIMNLERILAAVLNTLDEETVQHIEDMYDAKLKG